MLLLEVDENFFCYVFLLLLVIVKFYLYIKSCLFFSEFNKWEYGRV